MVDKKTESQVVGKNRDKNFGKKYQAAKQLVVNDEPIELSEALDLLAKTQVTKFDPTVEIHVNLAISGIRGTLTLPGGTAKTKKLLIIDEQNFEDETKKIESGKISFDVLVVKPEIMPKLAKFAKVLGPKGLMPNPKSGTVTEDPKKVSDEISGGRIEYKQDKDNIVHLAVGKLSFGPEKIAQNIKEVLRAMPANKIKSAYLNLTMGPSIQLFTGKK